MNATKITVVTSTDGLDGIPAELYAEAAQELVEDFFDGALVEIEVTDRATGTEIDIEGIDGPDLLEKLSQVDLLAIKDPTL